MVIIGLVVAVISAGFWLVEIDYGLKNAERIINTNKGVLARLIAGPKILMGFWAFVSDLIISGFFISFFGLGGVTGFIVGLAVSDIFSVAILVKLYQKKKTCA